MLRIRCVFSCSLRMLLGALLLATPGVRADEVGLVDLAIEDLLSLQVTSASKKSQPLIDTASAMHVIQAVDIRRSSATTVPDLLRGIPGVEVRQISGSRWAISARGFNNQFANKLLVMIDGRSTYSPLFGGVDWDLQSVPLHDIERIEIIRGPGAAIWGANAVNGVINIITKPASHDASMLQVTAGNFERQRTSFRLGRELENGVRLRLNGQLFHRSETESTLGGDFDDASRQGRFGLRADWDPNERDRLFLSMNAYRGDSPLVQRHDLAIPGSGLPAAVDPVTGFVNAHEKREHRAGDLVLNWRRTLAEDQAVELQFNYDTRRRGYGNEVRENRQTFEARFQHELRPANHHEVIWGIDARVTPDRITSTPNLDFGTRDSATEAVYSGFLQDEVDLSKEVLLTVGSKVGWNTFSGWEIQPSARLLWRITERQRLWTALSRAVRTPTRTERDFAALTPTVIPGGVPPCPGPGGCPVQLFGNDGLESEVLVAHELGYRVQATDDVSLDLSAFLNNYENVMLLQPTLIGAQPTTTNRGKAISYGAEAAGRWRVRGWWQLAATLTSFRLRGDQQVESPGYSVSTHSRMDLPGNIELDSWLYYTGDITGQTFGGTALEIDSHLRADLRLGWRARPGLILELVGQNLIDYDEEEWSSVLTPNGASMLPLSIFGRLTWEFGASH